MDKTPGNGRGQSVCKSFTIDFETGSEKYATEIPCQSKSTGIIVIPAVGSDGYILAFRDSAYMQCIHWSLSTGCNENSKTHQRQQYDVKWSCFGIESMVIAKIKRSNEIYYAHK